MIKKIDHFVITTSKIQECLEFYKKLGFRIWKSDGRYELYAGDFKINVHILHQELMPHATNVQTGSADVCFEVEDIYKFQDLLKDQSIEIELGIVVRSGVRGFMKSIYIRDIDGNLLEFCQYEGM